MKDKTDYLVIGGGASALAFVDVMLQESDATFAIVDRRPVPGGHWNDAYPFVRLHQPSGFYGVASRELGRNRKNESGFNKGLYELASGVEIVNYFHRLMEDVFLPSGRVSFHPLSEYLGDGAFVSLLSGQRHQLEVTRKVVNATHLTTSIPLTHKRKFEVADGVTCVPPNDLPRLAAEHRHITVLGGGKTGIDSVTWLLANGYPADAISWVVPRDSWMLNRAFLQPGLDFFDATIGGLATQYQILAEASTPEAMCLELEEAGMWLRLDGSVWPTMFHAATISEIELEHLRRVTDVIRLGRVRRVESDRLVFDGETRSTEPGALYVDCTASAVAGNVNDWSPVFSPGQISLQMVRPFQPCFSAALIGHIEATVPDDADKQPLTRATPMTDTVDDWLDVQAAGLMNQYHWRLNEDVSHWMARCRLDGFGRTVAQVAPDEPAKLAVLERLMRYAMPAAENLQRLSVRNR